MQEQNYKNHQRMASPVFYAAIFTPLVIAVLIFFLNTSNLLISLIALSIVIIGFFTRTNALKAQDRAIRAEENLRHFVLTGKLLDSKLTITQIVALRFASDDEFISLAIKAAEENLSNKEIKLQIKNWRGDYYRV